MKKEDFAYADGGQIENMVDLGLRHKNANPYDYLRHWLNVGRCFGYATKDDSWGEFEKIFSIIIKRMVLAEREIELRLPTTSAPIPHQRHY